MLTHSLHSFIASPTASFPSIRVNSSDRQSSCVAYSRHSLPKLFAGSWHALHSLKARKTFKPTLSAPQDLPESLPRRNPSGLMRLRAKSSPASSSIRSRSTLRNFGWRRQMVKGGQRDSQKAVDRLPLVLVYVDIFWPEYVQRPRGDGRKPFFSRGSQNSCGIRYMRKK